MRGPGSAGDSSRQAKSLLHEQGNGEKEHDRLAAPEQIGGLSDLHRLDRTGPGAGRERGRDRGSRSSAQASGRCARPAAASIPPGARRGDARQAARRSVGRSRRRPRRGSPPTSRTARPARRAGCSADRRGSARPGRPAPCRAPGPAAPTPPSGCARPRAPRSAAPESVGSPGVTVTAPQAAHSIPIASNAPGRLPRTSVEPAQRHSRSSAPSPTKTGAVAELAEMRRRAQTGGQNNPSSQPF